MLLLPFGLAAGAIAALKTAARRRPADVVVHDGGVRIEGGHLDGLTLEGNEIRADAWKLRQRGGVTELYIDMPGVDDLVLAESTDSREIQSFEATVATIAATFGARQSHAPSAVAADAVVRCPGCGHEIAPADCDATPCAFCGTEVPMPAEVRKRIANANEQRAAHAENRRLVTALLLQPGAHATNRLLAASGALMLMAWPACIGICLALLELHRLTAARAALLLALPVPLVVGLLLVTLWRLADRQALQLVTAGLVARPPAEPGEPHHCRECGAPLPDAGSDVLVQCLYCSAHNVLGLDVEPTARAEREQAGSLEQALAERHTRRTRGALFALAGVLVLAAGTRLLIGVTGQSFASAPPAAPSKPGIQLCLRWGSGWGTSYTCTPSKLAQPLPGSAIRQAVTKMPGYRPGTYLHVRTVRAGTDPANGGLGVMLDDSRNYSSYVVEREGTRSVYVDEVDAQ